MATERKARPMSGFFKFVALGAMAAGQIESFHDSENGRFIRLRNAVLRNARKEKAVWYSGAAVGISTDMASKLDDADRGKLMMFEFSDTEASKKGNPKKIFRVMELTGPEFDRLASSATDQHTQPYVAPKPDEPSLDDDTDNEPIVNDDGDDLPF